MNFNKLLLRKKSIFSCFLLFFLIFQSCMLGDSPNPKPPLKNINFRQSGVASYYANKFEGRQTASGEIFRQDSLTAAHKHLPFGTKVRVLNLKNNKTVTVRINDRGPFVKGRIIDLSRAAAEKIDLIQAGIAKVLIEAALSEADAERMKTVVKQ